jgi:hypothetical protein
MKKVSSQTLLRIYMALCLLIGILVAYYFGDTPTRTFLFQDMVQDDRLLRLGITYSFLLFVGGFIKGRFLNRVK